MKPGASTRPSRSTTSAAGAASSPGGATAAIRPSVTATSAARAAAPVPSHSLPPRSSRSVPPAPVGSLTVPPARPCGLEPVEPDGVAAHHLALRIGTQRSDLLAHYLERLRVQAGRVREVGLEHDVVLADRVDEMLQVTAAGLEPERS